MLDYHLHHGDCLHVLPSLDADSVDTVVTDPPYGLSFMGKDWDHGVPGVPFWREVYRVMKPGAMLCAFGGTRTFHRLTCAIEDAGFQIRDTLVWLYASGFPKSHDISKAIDREAGAERETIRNYIAPDGKRRWGGNSFSVGDPPDGREEGTITAPATPAAQTWHGYGTALKPAWEPIILAMKPLSGTFAQNALEHGVAGIWVDGCRVGTTVETWPVSRSFSSGISPGYTDGIEKGPTQETGDAPAGRWPPNVLLDPEAGEMVDRVSGESRSTPRTPSENHHTGSVTNFQRGSEASQHDDHGGASRFFPSIEPDSPLWYNRVETIQYAIRSCLSCGNENAEVTLSYVGESREAEKSTQSRNTYTSGSKITGRFLTDSSSITSTAKRQTTGSKTSSLSAERITPDTIRQTSGNETETGSGIVRCVTCGSLWTIFTDGEQQGDNDTVSLVPARSTPNGYGPTGSTSTNTSASLARKTSNPRIEPDELRFAYVPKASRAERNRGLEGLPERDRQQYGSIRQNRGAGYEEASTGRNHHPTVKPIDLLRWLVRLTRTPTGGVVLDPFAGSGSTGVACMLEARDFIGIELEAEYVEIARRRIEHVRRTGVQLSLFDSAER